MKLTTLIIFALLISIQSFCANRFWRGTTSSSWNNTNNWSLTSGGSTGVAVPTSSDAVTFDGSGNNPCVIDGTSNNCASLTMSGYTNTITMNCTSLNDAGALTLITGATYTQTAGTVVLSGSSTFTATSVTVPFNIQINGVTITLGSNITTTGNLSYVGATTLNSNTWNINGGTWTTGSNVSGTSAIVLGTTGNITVAGGGGVVVNNLTINTSGTVTFSNGSTFNYQTGTLTYTAGTVVTTGHTLNSALSTTFNINGMTLNIFTISANSLTFTLNSLFSATNITIGNRGVTWSGTAGFTCANYEQHTGVAALSNTLKSTNTYTVTNSIFIFGNTSFAISFVASTGSSSALLNYTGTTTCDKMQIFYANFTDVDASGGSKLWTLGNQTLTRTTNIGTVTAGTYPPITIFGN